MYASSAISVGSPATMSSYHRSVSGGVGGASSSTSPSASSAAAAPSGLSLAVQRNNLRMGLTRDIREGQKALREENYILEEILSEKHHMITATDMAEVLRGVGSGPDGARVSAILAARKPIQRLLVRQRGAERARLTYSEGPESLTREQRTKRAMLIADAGLGAPEVAVVRGVTHASVSNPLTNHSSTTDGSGGRDTSFGGGRGALSSLGHYGGYKGVGMGTATLVPMQQQQQQGTQHGDHHSGANHANSTVPIRPRSAMLFPQINQSGGGVGGGSGEASFGGDDLNTTSYGSTAHRPPRNLANRLAATDPNYYSTNGGGGNDASSFASPTRGGGAGGRNHSLVTSLNALSPHNYNPNSSRHGNATHFTLSGGASAALGGLSSFSPSAGRRSGTLLAGNNNTTTAAAAAPSSSSYRPSAANTLRVNYRELLLEQEEMHHKASMKQEHYEGLLKEALRFQELQTNFGE